MKMINLSAAVAAMLVFPVVLCSCSTGSEKEKKADSPVPVQEAKAEPQAVEVKGEPVLDNSKPETKPAAAEKKAEPAPAPAPEKKAEPAAAEVKAEPAPAPAPEKKAEPAPAPEKQKADKGHNRPVEHVVRTGDNLWNIAKKYYGSGAKWTLIYDANKSAIKKKDFLEPGTVLVIPASK